MHCVSERYDFTGDELGPAYSAAVDAIEAGELVVLPTDTVYGLAADAFKAEAVQRLLDTKGRGRDMPPPVLISVVDTMDALATDIPEAGRELCKAFWPGPLTVICHAQSSLMWDLGETQGTVALRVPDQADTRELLSRTGPLAVSSANLSGQPAATDVYDAERQLGDAVAVYLDGGESPKGEPSTIVDLTGDIPNVVRVGALSLEDLRKVVRRISGPGDPAPDEEPSPEPLSESLADDANKSAPADVSAPEDVDIPAPEDASAKKTDVPAAEDAAAETDVEKADVEKADVEKTDVDEKTDVEKTELTKADETKPGE